MLPHERSLVQRLATKPFALLGINSDEPAKLPEILKKEAITWRNAVAGGTDGALPTAWNVSGWPTIYVVDAKGVIRFRDVREAEMDKAVDALLAEIPAALPPAAPATK